MRQSLIWTDGYRQGLKKIYRSFQKHADNNIDVFWRIYLNHFENLSMGLSVQFEKRSFEISKGILEKPPIVNGKSL